MTVESLSQNTVKLLAEKVKSFSFHLNNISYQILMSDKLRQPKSFEELRDEDKDLTMFKVTNLTLTNEENRNMVSMAIKLKRKVVTELLTTYLPTILLLFITFTSIFFDKELFGDVIAVNLTIMLVMTTIFTSKIEELPPTSDMKMIDVWLIFCLVVPFLEVILRTAMECATCRCRLCKPKDADKNTSKTENEDEKVKVDPILTASPKIWVTTGAKVAPQTSQKVQKIPSNFIKNPKCLFCQDLAKKKIPIPRGKCPKRTWIGFLEITGGKKELAKNKILSN